MQAGRSGAGEGYHGLADSDSERRDGQQVRLQPGEPRQASAQVAGRGCDLWRSIPILCDGGKIRRIPCDEEGRIEPALFPLADAGTIRNRVGLLRGSGNAISPFPAAEFIAVTMEAA